MEEGREDSREQLAFEIADKLESFDQLRQFVSDKEGIKMLEEQREDWQKLFDKICLELKRREIQIATLSRTLADYQNLVENANDAILVADNNGEHVYVNQAASDLIGLERHKLLQKAMQEIIHQNKLAEVSKRSEERMAGLPTENKYRSIVINEAGDNVPVEITAFRTTWQEKPVTVAMIRDISEVQAREEELKKERDWSQKILDIAGVMIVVLDKEKKVIQINKKGCEILGYSEDEIKGEGWDKFIPEADHSDVHAIFGKAISGELDDVRQHLNPVLRQDKTQRMIEWINNIFEDDRGNAIATVSSGHDITNLLEAKREREALLREIHHRVNNNLQIVIGCFNFRARKIKDPEARLQIENIIGQIHAMAETHKSLYASESLTYVDIDKFLQNLLNHSFLELYKIQGTNFKLTKNIESKIEIDQAIPCALLINEIVGNAARHAFPDGKQGKIHVELTEQEEDFILRISDDGVGISDNVDITKNDSVGMTLIKILTDQLGGQVQLQVENGTTFTIRFPKDAD